MGFFDKFLGKGDRVKNQQKSSTGLSTQPYKGVRDFYPEDMAVQRYIFDVWSMTAESFGFERYDASVLEPAELYRAKGADNEEMVNDQTYTFTDRGGREVTLRPEMTPTVARLIAGKRQQLTFPVRWYSIPNLFRYERTQRGRLREHWQLNCDIFGTDDYTADVEIIALAYHTLINFGADPSMFTIKLNNRASLNEQLKQQGIKDEAKASQVIALLDRKLKMSEGDFASELKKIAGANFSLNNNEPESVKAVREALHELGIENVVYEPAIVRGFNYYTGTVFEIFDNDSANNRSMLGGGRYDNLTGLFGGEAISGVGFGMGDVTMKNFLESHDLLTADITTPQMMIIPTDPKYNLEAAKVAQTFRSTGMSVAVDLSERKLGKKISSAGDSLVEYALVLGEDEVTSGKYTVKNLVDGKEESGTLQVLLKKIN